MNRFTGYHKCAYVFATRAPSFRARSLILNRRTCEMTRRHGYRFPRIGGGQLFAFYSRKICMWNRTKKIFGGGKAQMEKSWLISRAPTNETTRQLSVRHVHIFETPNTSLQFPEAIDLYYLLDTILRCITFPPLFYKQPIKIKKNYHPEKEIKSIALSFKINIIFHLLFLYIFLYS